MVGKTIGRSIDENMIPVYVERFGHSKDDIFVTAGTLRRELGDAEFERLPAGALGLYTYYERLDQGLRHREAAEVSGIPYVVEVDQDEVEKLLASCVP
jgi:hypothetical protein